MVISAGEPVIAENSSRYDNITNRAAPLHETLAVVRDLNGCSCSKMVPNQSFWAQRPVWT